MKSTPQVSSVLDNRFAALEHSLTSLTEYIDKLAKRPWVKDRFDGVWVFTSGLYMGFLGAGVAIIMDVSLAWHNKLSVLILELYAGASLVVWFSQAGNINSLIVKTVNESSFVILGGDFNEDGFRSADESKWIDFKYAISTNAVMFLDEFAVTMKFSDLDTI
ncbi:hypothetical protein G9A89_012057 [Geosiphon pyriformis]|nr:hypothetical protein G9A89_012057 [Geosiphon pyriformis]